MELATLIVLSQLTDAYIRWLAFSKTFNEVRLRLFASSAAWSLLSLLLYVNIFEEYGINATTYKGILMLGWLPYFLLAVKLIPWGLPQHVFVFGMGAICSLVQHTVAAFVILPNFSGQSDSEIILADAAGYLLLFVAALPIVGRCFVNLLPSREFFDLRPQGLYVAILPLVIVSGHLMRIADDVLVHSWAERFSRIYLPLMFFFFYRYILTAAKNFYDLQKLERNKIRLEEQLTALKEYNELIQENQRQVSIMRHDLRHSYNLIYAMLAEGNVLKAREHISTQEFLLETTEESFSKSPPINAALTICLRRAEEAGVRVLSKIELPNELETDETDFALLLKNLLERAIVESFQCESRELSIIIEHVDGQCILEISVSGAAQIDWGDTLKTFAKKYSARADFSQGGGNTNLLMYWRDGGS